MVQDNRDKLLTVFDAALRAVEGGRCVADYLRRHPRAAGSSHVVAIGKAAATMAEGARSLLGGRLVGGLVITKDGHCGGLSSVSGSWRCLEAGHPQPDVRSLEAGEALLRFLDDLPPEAPLLFLVSGGTSALVEVLPDGVTLSDLAKVNRWLLASGLDIGAVNRVRKQLSAIKAGRLAQSVQRREVCQLLLSDVPGDDPTVIGSGLLVADANAALPLSADLPAWLRNLLSRASPPPLPDAPCFARIVTEVVGSNREARQAAARAAGVLGWPVEDHGEALRGDAACAGDTLGSELLAAAPGLHIWGGETTVVLPPHPGRGGRNQTLALAAARRIADREGVWLLAAGTDGTDGPTTDAGALVDGGTISRGADAGLEPDECLHRADAGSFLEASGDLVHTGPTGTNVMDLVLGLKLS